jgi:hypothetical protein
VATLVTTISGGTLFAELASEITYFRFLSLVMTVNLYYLLGPVYFLFAT